MNEPSLSRSWAAFVTELQTHILPIYLQHERTFDAASVHGRMHICRTLLFAEILVRQYAISPYSDHLKADAIRMAIAFHDSGRQANGVDLWEKDSARLCFGYVLTRRAQRPDPKYARYVSRLIVAEGRRDLEKEIVHDADTLDIMRPCCGHGGLAGFRRDELFFQSGRDRHLTHGPELQDQLIQEAWRLIQWTETCKNTLLDTPTPMDALLDVLETQRHEYFLLSNVCHGR